ncbi:MAG: DUF177 domain-containing protein [Bacteroidetes bacterium]|nr:DUF177 domain-containing protein [Bacteroidota bacterium]
MDYLTQFVIPFIGLKPGLHTFDWEIEDKFFEYFEYSEIKTGRISVHAELEKDERMLVFHFTLDGTVLLPCDRCYETLEQKIEGKEILIIKFGVGYYEENEELQIIPEGETHLDVSSFIYEYCNLHLPARRVHPDDENGVSFCNPETLKKLEMRPASTEPDPRWEKLNKLRKDQKA